MRDERGSLLLIAVVTLTVLVLVIGTAVPVAGVASRQELERETLDEIFHLRRGMESYYEDNERFPDSLANLLAPSDEPNWLGPYVNDGFADQVDTSDDVIHDPWRRPYVYTHPDPWTAMIRSVGPNGLDEQGQGDDIQDHFGMHYAIWLITMRELRILRPAIHAYNEHVGHPELPHPWNAVVNRLQAVNILPKGPEAKFRFWWDGWGNEYNPLGDPIDDAESLGPPQ